MFRIKYKERGIDRVENNIDDIRTLYDILIGILNDEKKEEEIGKWCSNAQWGDSITLHGITVECYKEGTSVKKARDSEIVNKIANSAGVPCKFIGLIDNRNMWDFELGLVSLWHDIVSGQWTLSPMRSNGVYACKPIIEMSTNMLMPKAIKVLAVMKEKYIYEIHNILHTVANKISEKTGISNEWVGEENGSLVIKFHSGQSYMHNMHGEGLRFVYKDSNGKEIFSYSTKHGARTFIKEVAERISKVQGNKKATTVSIKQKSIKNEDILKEVRDNNKLITLRIYEDNCWWLDIEKTYNKNFRVWVGFEDKRSGKSRASIVSLYRTSTGDIQYSTDGIILKKAVANKLISTVKFLMKNEIMNID